MLKKFFPFILVKRSFYKKAKKAFKFHSQWSGIDNILESSHSEPEILQTNTLQKLHEDTHFSIFDIGANSGDWTRAFQQRFPNSTIHAVEAAPETFKLLIQSTAYCPDIHCHQCACNSTKGTIRFYSDHRCSLLSSVLDLPDAQGQTSPVEIPADTLDNLVEAHSPTRLRLIKIDTEGHDLAVLQGAHKVLSSCDLKYIILEFGLDPLQKRHVHLNTFCQHLGKYNFFLSDISGFGVFNGSLYGNALFVKIDTESLSQ